MIKINLLQGERKAVKKKAPLQLGQKLTVGCSLILLIAGLFIGWRYWTTKKESAQLDQDIAKAQDETVRMHSIISQVQTFEQRRAQLQQRVALIEQLRKQQTGPVHMLDQISRALPPMLWLTELKEGSDSNEVIIDGRCLSQTAVSDFVANLEGSGYFKKSIDIVSSTSEAAPAQGGELIKFELKALFQQPGDPSKTPAAAPVGAPTMKGN